MTVLYYVRQLPELWVIAATLLTAARTPAVQELVGEWDMVINSPRGTVQAVLKLTPDGGGLSGSFAGSRGEQLLETATLAGPEVRFTVRLNLQGRPIIYTYKGHVDRGTMTGTVDFAGRASGDWSARRRATTPLVATSRNSASPSSASRTGAPTGPVNVGGVWRFDVLTTAGSGTPIVVFIQVDSGLTGTYKSDAVGEVTLVGALKGSDITFSFEATIRGQSVKVQYDGRMTSSDSMEGAATLGALGVGKWTATRVQQPGK